MHGSGIGACKKRAPFAILTCRIGEKQRVVSREPFIEPGSLTDIHFFHHSTACHTAILDNEMLRFDISSDISQSFTGSGIIYHGAIYQG